MSDRFLIELGATGYQPGEVLSGTLSPLEPVEVGEVSIALEYRDWTADYHSTSRTVPLALSVAGSAEEPDKLRFTGTLPADALPNMSGVSGSTSWGVHARVARVGPDAHQWCAIQVLTAALQR